MEELKSGHEFAWCQLCGHKQQVPEYREWNCVACGQRHKYDEGYCVVLSDEQKARLRIGTCKECRFWQPSALTSDNVCDSPFFIGDAGFWPDDVSGGETSRVATGPDFWCKHFTQPAAESPSSSADSTHSDSK